MILQHALAALLAAGQVQAGPNSIPESAGVLIAYAPSGMSTGAGFQLDRLFDAARGRTLSTDAAMPPALARTRPLSSYLPPSQEYQRTFRILSRHRERIDRFDPLIVKYSERFHLNPRLLKAIVAAESEFNVFARSPAGALGLMQLMPLTAECVGVPREQLFNPEENIRAGAAYMAYLFKVAFRQNGIIGHYAAAPEWLVRRVIAAYNGGLKFLRGGRKLYRETKHYVAKVFLYKNSSVTKISLARP